MVAAGQGHIIGRQGPKNGDKMKRSVELDKNDIQDAIYHYLKEKFDKCVPYDGKWVILDYDAKNKIVDFVYRCELTEKLGNDFPNSALDD